MSSVTRFSSRIVQNYVDQVKEENYEVPNDQTLRAISTTIDASFQRSYDKVTEMMASSSLITKGVSHLSSNRTCGGFKPENASLKNLTAFEQMYTVAEYIDQHPQMSRQPRTYAFYSGEDEVVPIWVKHPSKGKASLWTTLLGTTKGRLKAPSYEDLTLTDPENTPAWIFINSLTALEMHRNPSRIGALAIKAASYERGRIDHTWRFQNYAEDGKAYLTASAELKKQKTKKTREMVAQASGYNLCGLLSLDGTADNTRNLLPVLNFEDFAQEGYHDDSHPCVTPKSIIKALPKTLKGDTDQLDELTSRVFATQLGRSKIPKVRRHVARTLFPNAKQDD